MCRRVQVAAEAQLVHGPGHRVKARVAELERVPVCMEAQRVALADEPERVLGQLRAGDAQVLRDDVILNYSTGDIAYGRRRFVKPAAKVSHERVHAEAPVLAPPR